MGAKRLILRGNRRKHHGLSATHFRVTRLLHLKLARFTRLKLIIAMDDMFLSAAFLKSFQIISSPTS